VNTLVATAAGGPALSEAYESLKIIGPGVAGISTLTSGEFALDVGIGGAFGFVADAAEFIIDPIASMASSVAGFLLDYMPPLPDMLDSIAGNPSAVEAKATTWANISSRVADSADELDAAVRQALTGWSGPAAAAYETFSQVLSESLRTMSGMCSGIGGAMQAASAVVGFVRAIVRDVIADLVGKLISWASQVALTAGVGASWVVPQAVSAIALRVERVRGWLQKLTSAAESYARVVSQANDALSRGVPALRRVADALDARVIAPAVSTGTGTIAPVTLVEVIKSATSVSGTLSKSFDAATQASGSDDR
jgi:uncharacterized protein YukE